MPSAILKFTALVTFLLILISASGQQGASPRKPAQETVPPKTANHHDTDSVAFMVSADSIITYAKKFMGVRYCYGGEDTKGFDCAGYVCFVFRHFGIKLPRMADAQALLGKDITLKNAKPGDLIFFKGSNTKNKAVGHSGIVVENHKGKIRFISSTTKAGVHIDELEDAYWKERFVSIRRILKNERMKE